MSGGGGGKVILWDIEKGTSINTFTETGIYHRDPNILNEVFDGKFTSCGKFFVVTTVWGTFTIYSIYDKESYLATPVEQFFQYDKLPEATSNIYNEKDAHLCNYDRMKYPEQPPPPILGERYLGKFMTHHDYEQEYRDRYSKFSKDQKFFENYAEEFAPYAFLNTAMDNRGNEDASSQQQRRDESMESEPGEQRRNNRSMYYDPHNDQFDRDSDEDFVIESSPERAPTRRTIRRQPYNSVRDNARQEERKISQREERRRRLRQRTRLREGGTSSDVIDESNDEPDDFVINDIREGSESEYSEDLSMRESSKKKPVIRNHNFYSSRMEDEYESEEIIPERPAPPKTRSNRNSGMFSSNRVIVEEQKGLPGEFKSFDNFLSKHNTEDYKFEKKLQTDGYHLDIAEAQSLRDMDKSTLDCALCKKKKGENSLIGPFKYYIRDKITDEMAYWFHRE